ncbi:MAG: hypothetical protein AB6733_03745 [Clostridiaceae bacterium]
MEELIKNHHWKQNEVINENMTKVPNIRKKYLIAIGSAILILLISYIALLLKGRGNWIYALIFVGNLLAFVFGGLIVTLLIIFYNNVLVTRSRKEMNRSYSRLINSDIVRIHKTFKDKKFTLMRIGRLSILDDWVMILSNISVELSEKEINSFVSFYKQLDYIDSLIYEFNNHIKELEKVNLKDYPHMKEYNNSATLLTKEFNKLFAIEIDELLCKLNKLA